MNAENVKSQMRKGYLEYCILLIICKKPAYVSDIISELKEAKMIVVEGTLYPLLTRLKNNGILQYQWQESASGPPRKYYELTDSGRAFLAELEAGWEELKQAVEHLKNEESQNHIIPTTTNQQPKAN
ncbi:MAG: PadR family transcriptional regulator [Bacteroidales bacterium]|nr:PadR family transcriptional regulator [Bacteroidales bacterium]